MSSDTIIVTGGAGYIGSHMVLELQAQGYRPVVLDDLSRGYADAVPDSVPLYRCSVHDIDTVRSVFQKEKPVAVMHFAAFMEVGESVRDPSLYYYNNVGGTSALVQAMLKEGIERLIFSSTAAVYGHQQGDALSEDAPKKPVNPYGASKLAAEQMLDEVASQQRLRVGIFRYFNACGADPFGRARERHNPETHLIPLALQTAAGLRPTMSIFGTDYATPDGTCLRDYVHVSDLCHAHCLGLEHLNTCRFFVYNLGLGKAFSVREVLHAARAVTGQDFAILEQERREGDPAVLLANPQAASQRLGWKPQYPELATMIAHAWRHYS